MRKIFKSKTPFIFTSVSILVLVLFIAGLSLGSLPGVARQEELKGPLFQESPQAHVVDPQSFEGKIIDAIKKVSPAVVSISTQRTVTVPGMGQFPGPFSRDFNDFFQKFFNEFPQRKFKQRGLGSGMIINKDGYILTNEHLIHGVDKDKITVTLSSNKSYKANIVGTDTESDIAVLKIEGDSFPSVVFGNSDNLQVGQWVIAVGNPFGYALSELNKKYEPTVTTGVISATGRAIQAGQGGGRSKVYSDLIQTDASINPGNSGGPLVNIYGEVIGINTAILSPSGGSIGIGFAIPINKAKRLLESLVKYGQIKWPWIGIYMQELTPELAEKIGVKKGVLVADIVSSSPADKAGIKPGDVIQKVNAESVNTPFDLKEAVLKSKIGEKINLTLVREGKEISVELQTAPKPEGITETKIEQGAITSKLLGVKVGEITPQLRRHFEMGEKEKGVLIVEVLPGGPADKVGITAGDVIKGVNRKPVDNLADFHSAMSEVNPGDTVLLRIKHGVWTTFVTVETAK